MCSGPAQEAERDGGKMNTTASDTQRELHGEPSDRTKNRAEKTLVTRGLHTLGSKGVQKSFRPVRRPTLLRTKIAVGNFGRGILAVSPTYQFFKNLRGPKQYRDDEI